MTTTHHLSRRLNQTMAYLLEGDSEKQVAYKLKVSKHTVHVYVKALYRRFDVSSRAEFMAKCLRGGIAWIAGRWALAN